MEAHGVEEPLFHALGFNLDYGRSCAEEYGKGRAGFIPFLVQATQLAQKIHSVF